MKTAWIGLGSNIGDSMLALRRAIAQLARLPDTQLRSVSAAYRTAPWGDTDQPEFLNAVAKLATSLPPRSLLEALLAIEGQIGRKRNGRRWGPREIDLDLLVYEDTVLDEPGLTLPHPRLHERAFVLVPLNELSPGLEIPGHGQVGDLLAALDAEDLAGVQLADSGSSGGHAGQYREQR
ncbi:MAG: 2-amino-4-hydroxy-6-hydroxymethyldihydropteridine diphosphokinase [Wenzhouxiangella sp.]|nr:MAG: 2-amino-4-hydroxy-6-hydroxymethyldihydropteridine diphosphokinase [Wenzhouxiangella sp.]